MNLLPQPTVHTLVHITYVLMKNDSMSDSQGYAYKRCALGHGTKGVGTVLVDIVLAMTWLQLQGEMFAQSKSSLIT